MRCPWERLGHPRPEPGRRSRGLPTGAGVLPRMDLATLPGEVKELVRAQLEAGRFQSVDEVVVEALRLLQEREELFASHRDQLRAVRRRIDERLRSGE